VRHREVVRAEGLRDHREQAQVLRRVGFDVDQQDRRRRIGGDEVPWRARRQRDVEAEVRRRHRRRADPRVGQPAELLDERAAARVGQAAVGERAVGVEPQVRRERRVEERGAGQRPVEVERRRRVTAAVAAARRGEQEGGERGAGRGAGSVTAHQRSRPWPPRMSTLRFVAP
jgi:hypothetical protein